MNFQYKGIWNWHIKISTCDTEYCFKQWWSTTPWISTKQSTTSHLKSMSTKKHDIFQLKFWFWLERHKNVAELKWDSHPSPLYNGIPTLPHSIMGSPMAIQIHCINKQYKAYMHSLSQKKACRDRSIGLGWWYPHNNHLFLFYFSLIWQRRKEIILLVFS